MKQPMNKSKKFFSCFFPIILNLIILVVILTGCGKKEKEPIKIGFVGGLTGRISDLGISGKQGVSLAVEQINQAGGINGRPVELIIKNDKQDPEVAVQVDQELIKEGVVAIIGHITSSMSMVAVPQINKEKIVMLSPTASTNDLAGIDDYFLRVQPPNIKEDYHLAQHAFKGMKLRKMAGVYDLSNRAYTEGCYSNFVSKFESMGGTLIFTTTFTSGQEVSHLDIAKNILNSNPEGLMIAAGALDTAMICQHLRKLGSHIPVVSSGWAMTPDFLQHGGTAVEGVVFSIPGYVKDSKDKRYLEFRKQFNERFGKEPNFSSVNSYEAAQVLFIVLSKTDDVEKIKDTILNQQIFPGLQGDIKIDKYGDADRKAILQTVKNGQYKTME